MSNRIIVVKRLVSCWDLHIDLLNSISLWKNATLVQVALAWLLVQKPWIVLTPDTRKMGRLDENIGSVAVELTPDGLREIERAASQIIVQGALYLEHLTGR